MVSKLPIISLVAFITGCGAGPAADGNLLECQEQLAQCSKASGDDSVPAASSAALTPFEQEVMKDLIASVKAGVRPVSENGLGICPKHSDPKKKRECETMLGNNPGELAEGEYILYSEWAVPDVGAKGTWKIKFETECTTTRVGSDGSESTSNRSSSKEYDVVYAGKDRGYRIAPLRRITSPSPGGKVSCTYKLTAPHGDGDRLYEGGWTLPEAPK
jgi:hypothetical protein